MPNDHIINLITLITVKTLITLITLTTLTTLITLILVNKTPKMSMKTEENFSKIFWIYFAYLLIYI